MKKFLVEYDRNAIFGPASEESVAKYAEALKNGKPFFMYPYHGYELRMVVRTIKSPDEEHELYGH